VHKEGRIWSKMWKKRYWKLWMMNVKDLNFCGFIYLKNYLFINLKIKIVIIISQKLPLKINNSKTWKPTTSKIAQFHFLEFLKIKAVIKKIKIWNLKRIGVILSTPFKELKLAILMKKWKLPNIGVNHY